MAAAIGVPPTPHRVDSDASATAMMVALLCCSNSRVIIGLKLVSDDCAQSIEDMRSPGSQSRTPTKLNPGALEHAGVIAERELLHPLQDEQLDLGDLGEVDQRFGGRALRHGTGTRSTMSSMTISTVTPWLAACGPSQTRCAEHVLRQILDVLRIHLRAPPPQQRPHLDEPPPADGRARRRAEVHALLDQFGRRVVMPLGLRRGTAAWRRRAGGCTSPGPRAETPRG